MKACKTINGVEISYEIDHDGSGNDLWAVSDGSAYWSGEGHEDGETPDECLSDLLLALTTAAARGDYCRFDAALLATLSYVL